MRAGFRFATLIVLLGFAVEAYGVKSLRVDIPKSQSLIVEVPPPHWSQKDTSWGGGIPIFVLRADSSVTASRNWEDGSLPMLAEFHVEKAHDCGGSVMSGRIVGCPAHWSEVELRSDRAWLKLQFPPETDDLTAAVKLITFWGGKEQFINSSYVHDVVFLPNQARLFSATPTLSAEARFSLFQTGLRLGSDVKSTTFKGRTYVLISIPLFTTFNTIRTSSDQRIAEVIREAILPQAKLFDGDVSKSALDGLAFDASVPAYNFVTGGENKTDQLTIYMPLSSLNSFVESDITSQRLMDSSTVLLNNDRIEAKL